MVGIGTRMNKLKESILRVRVGPGAAILPPDVTRIHMDFAKEGDNGQFGAKEFFKTCLPRLKYWNPAVPMIVNRSSKNPKSIMTIFLRRTPLDPKTAASRKDQFLITPNNQPSSSFLGKSEVPKPLPEERTVQIDMLMARRSAILQQLLEATKAVPVQPTEEEIDALGEIRARKAKAVLDREISLAMNAEKKKEEAIMAQAREEAAAMKQAL